MSRQLIRPDRFFFGTRSLPCPYVRGKTERKVVTDLSGPDANELYERLSQAGFRRSHNVAYRPACPKCVDCVPVRIVASDFIWTRSFRRVVRNNKDLKADDIEAIATIEQYRLFSEYQRQRHQGGEMSGMGYDDYRAMIEDTPVSSRTVEFRDKAGHLNGVMLMDRMEKSLSAVYSFFKTTVSERSLGTYMILWMVEQAHSLSLPHVYLGYWITGSEKMAYKARFQPLEALGLNGWKIQEK